jgi:hypothetical protein
VVTGDPTPKIAVAPKIEKLRAERERLNRMMEIDPSQRTASNYALRDSIARKLEAGV